MPYKKNNRKNYNKNKKRGFNKSRMSNLKKVVGQVLMKKSETKLFPLETTISLGANQGQIINVSSVATQGTDAEQRVGDRIQGIGLEIRGILRSKVTSGLQLGAQLIRCIVFRSNRNEFSTVNDNICLSTANEPTQLTTDDTTDIIRSLNKKQFTVMYDKTIKLSSRDFDATATHAVGQGTKDFITFKKFFKFNLPLLFPVDASGEAERNNLRVLYIYRQVANTATTADDVIGEVMTRFYYKDF